MKITEEDRTFYYSAIDHLYEKLEISQEFIRHNGMSALPVAEMTDLMIIGVKDWLGSIEGEMWLGTIGYNKVTQTLVSGSTVVSYGADFVSNMDSICPVCSGSFPYLWQTICEQCGQEVCSKCQSIVDDHYGIGWCLNCVG